MDTVKKEIQSLLGQWHNPSLYVAMELPAVVVSKPNGDICLCVNYQELSCVTIPLPNLEALIAQTSRSSFISTLDLSKGFRQVPVDPQSITKDVIFHGLG